MKKLEFQNEIDKVVKIVKTFPPDVRQNLMQVVQETIDRHKVIVETCQKARRSAMELKNAQDDMRLAVKYMIFDIECNAREQKEKK